MVVKGVGLSNKWLETVSGEDFLKATRKTKLFADRNRKDRDKELRKLYKELTGRIAQSEPVEEE